MAFLVQNYLLGGETAFELFQQVGDLPIVDPHTHADVQQILDDQPFADIWQAEAATDHYVWEMLRKRGVDENLITGNAGNREKWMAMAEVFPWIAGSPTYEWIHLDLRRQLGVEELVNRDNAATIWRKTAEILQKPEMRPRALLRRMKVETLASTDDPVDSLEAHRKLAAECPGLVRPTFRPDQAMNIFKDSWRSYITSLERRFNHKFHKLQDLVEALRQAHDWFAEHGCVASDHGLETPYGYHVEAEDADAVFRKAYNGHELEQDEVIAFMSYLLNQLAEMDAEKDWVFQLHIGVTRDIRDSLFNTIGADSGGDVSDHLIDYVEPLAPLLNRFDGRLKTVLYCIEPGHQASVAALCRAFGAKVNPGSAWWLNDSPIGMKRQLEYVGSVDLLANLAGMVSDSRKLLSYGSRHEMFRRTLCEVLGAMVDRGQMPREVAGELACYLCYQRPRELFGLAGLA